jgi:transposase
MEQEITLSRKELARLDVISKANAGFITVREAAEALGLSERQVKRLKKEAKGKGAEGIVHGNRGRKPPNRVPEETRSRILELRGKPEYRDSNFEHFREMLSELQGIEVSYSFLYGLLASNGIKTPKTRRRFKPHRRRKRRPQAGLLVQVDATPFSWFRPSGDRKMYALHGAIDDATGQIVSLYMTKNESLQGYFEMFKRMARAYGIPVGVYADRHSIFQSPNTAKAEIDKNVKVNDTQLGRCLKKLGVTLIPARSPQAKGRIERLWETLQGRLPTEFAARGITTIDKANPFLENYAYAYNSRFAVEPKDPESVFRNVDGVDLDHAFCVREERVVDAGGVFTYLGKSFKIVGENSGIVPPHARIGVLVSPVFGIEAEYKGTTFSILDYVPPKRRPKTIGNTAETDKPKAKPGQKYKEYAQTLLPHLSFAESREEILDMLYDIFLRKYA